MGLPRLSIKHPVSTLMVMLIAVVIGLVSLLGSPMELMPKINPPIAVVLTVFPGASPEEVASLVTKPLEDAVATTAGLSTLTSTSKENMSLVMLQFDWGTDMGEVRSDIQQALDRVDLPEGAQKPSLIKFDPNAAPVMEMTAASGENLSDLKHMLETEIQPRLEKVDGVAAVFITGAPDKEVQVLLDQEKLAQYGLTQSQIASVIQASNLTYPAGKVTLNDKAMNLRIVGKTDAVEQLKSLVVTQVPDLPAAAPAAAPTGAKPGAAPVPTGVSMKAIRLSDVAQVGVGYADATELNQTNGKPSLRISIQKEGAANTVDVARAVEEELEEITKDHRNLDLVTVMNQGDIIRGSVDSVNMSLISGGLLAVLVLLAFLRNFRPTLIIGVAIPFSVIVTFVLLYMNDLSLNLMTLGGLALGVGMLVDNAIVVIENIYRHLNELGEDPYTAAEKGANEVSGAITSSTLTTVAVFLPVAFVGGLTGELFKELALTVTFSLIASLAVALTVIPMMASRFLKAQKVSRRRKQELNRFTWYTGVLRWALSNRAITLVVAVAMLAGSIALVPQIGTEFLPTADEGSFTIQVKMPPGTSLETTAKKVAELAAAVKKEIPAETVLTTSGSPEGVAGLSSATGTGGDASIKVKMDEEYDEPTEEAMQEVREALESLRGDATLSYNLDSSAMGLGSSQPNGVQIVVTGPDTKTVHKLVAELQAEMADIEGLTTIENNLDTARPELQVVVNQEKAMQNGLVPAQVAMTVADAVKGKIVTRIDAGGETADVRVQFRAQDRDSPARIEQILLKNPMGKTIPLSAVAEVKEAHGPVSVTRENQKTSAQVTALLEDRDLGSVTADINAVIDDMKIPDGYDISPSGASKLMSEGFEGLNWALLLAIVLIYMIMASQFESLLHPFTILFTMPLAVIGVVGGLFVTGNAMGITAMIGVIILAGIVVNNGIVLVDFINQLRREGWELTEAVVEAGRTRLRPILMTALTTILGLLPLALKIGEGSEIQAPMAVTVIGGLLTSTVLTLVIIPVLYHVMAGGRAVVRPADEEEEDDLDGAGEVPAAQGALPAMAGAQAEVAVALEAPVAAPAVAVPSPTEAKQVGRAELSADEKVLLQALLGKLLNGAAPGGK